MQHKTITFDLFIRGLLVVAGIVGAILIVSYLSSVLVPFCVAWFAAYLVYPVVEFFEQRLHLRWRVCSILATIVLLVAVVYGIWLLTWPSIVEEAARFKDIIVAYIQSGSHNDSIAPEIHQAVTNVLRHFNIEKILATGDMMETVQNLLSDAWNVLQASASFLVGVVSSLIAILYFFLILYDFKRLARGVRSLVPPRHKDRFNHLLDDMQRSMSNYFRGQFLISVSVGVLFCIGFMIIDLPLAIPLGLLIGMLSFVPYLHGLGLIPAVLLCIVKAADTGQNFWIVLLACLVVFVVVQLIQDLFLTPKIMGDAMGLPPYLVLLSLSIWGYVLGLMGLILALPLTTLMLSYYKRYIAKTLPDEAPEPEPDEASC